MEVVRIMEMINHKFEVEVAWEDRGKIPRIEFDKDVDGLSNIKCLPWDDVSETVKDWWNRIFDACVSTKKLTTIDGKEILVTGEN